MPKTLKRIMTWWRRRVVLPLVEQVVINRRLPALDARQNDVEQALDGLKREIAELNILVVIQARRLAAMVDLYEQRLDRIHARVGSEVAARLDIALIVESEEAVDDRIAELVRTAIGADVPVAPPLSAILSGRLMPGTLASPLTVQGFRINRKLAREVGDAILIGGATVETAGVAVYGPYKLLSSGKYRLSAHIDVEPTRAAKGDIVLDVFSAQTQGVVNAARKSARTKGAKAIVLEFDWPPAAAVHGVEFRLHQKSNASFKLAAFDLVRLNA